MKDDVAIEITEAAGDWFDILSVDDIATEQREQFVEWLNRSPVHITEFLRVSALHAELSGAMAAFPPWAEELLTQQDATVIEVPGARHETIPVRNSEVTGGATQNSKRFGTPHSGRWLALAAMLLVSVSVVLWIAQLEDSSRLITGIGEQRVVILDDGSRVQLNTDSEVKIRFREEVRELELVRGELLVDVQKDSERPFIVSTDRATVRATGTSFNVYRRQDTTEITVIEGRVLVNWPSSSSRSGATTDDHRQPLELDAGRKTVISENESTPQSLAVDIDQTLAWTEHLIKFDDETVATVANEFNRYNRSRLVVSDPVLAQRRITGVMDVNDTGAFLALLGGLTGIEIMITSEGHQQIKSKSTRKETDR